MENPTIFLEILESLKIFGDSRDSASEKTPFIHGMSIEGNISLRHCLDSHWRAHLMVLSKSWVMLCARACVLCLCYVIIVRE